MADVGIPNGIRSEHTKDSGTNGTPRDHGQNGKPDFDKGKGVDPNTPEHLRNGPDAGNAEESKTKLLANVRTPTGKPSRPRMNDLPDEIVHITQGFVPLAVIISRLAQATHDDLQKAILEAAEVKWMPLALNGNAANGSDLPDDVSEGNLKRKTILLKFAQDAHTKLVKALVITDWSRKAGQVSKLIDLKAHLDGKRVLFDTTLGELIDLKRSLGQARLPRPDLKTALQILTTGEAPWIPEPGYIPLPVLTVEEKLKWIEELNTLLSLRLNLDDFDKIPVPFKDYTIQSGRVTFKVKGEFEVDLTIADEDFEKQFWFIDFRFDFSPSSKKPSDMLMSFLEAKVNEVLGTDGLAGCYKFLHEFVLTHKINELRRQADELARSTWSGNLKVEPLHRALAIQYWTHRHGHGAPKSWIMVAVHSAGQNHGASDPKRPSHLVSRWYRDGKEMKDFQLTFDVNDLSAKILLKSAVAFHVQHILSSIHDKLAAAPRFARKETFLKLAISKSEPLESCLEMQLGREDQVTLLIEPVTGFAAIRPHTSNALRGEVRLNHGSKDPAEDGVVCLENIRWGYVVEEFNRRGRSAGWSVAKSPIGGEDIKALVKNREPYQPVFFQRQGLGQDWFVMLSLSLAGDEWWLLQINGDGDEPSRSIRANVRLPLTKGQPEMDDKFWDGLTVFASGIISHVMELSGLRTKRIRFKTRQLGTSFVRQQLRIPAVVLRLSDILPGTSYKSLREKGSNKMATGWAEDAVEIQFKGLRPFMSARDVDSNSATSTEGLGTVVEAVIKVKNKSKFTQLPSRIGSDVVFDRRTGQFVLRIRGSVGIPVLEVLANHVKSIGRLVTFLDAISCAKGAIKCGEVGLRKCRFSYVDVIPPEGKEQPREWTATLDMSKVNARLELQQDNPHLRMLDLLNNALNTPRGLHLMAIYIPKLLPVLRALDTIEARWEELEPNGHGQVQVIAKAVDWISLHYHLPSVAGKARQLMFSIHTRSRRGEAYWFVERAKSEANVDPNSIIEVELSKVVSSVWGSRGTTWQGLGTGAAAKMAPGAGVMDLLLAIDDAVKEYAMTKPSTASVQAASNQPTQASGSQDGKPAAQQTNQGKEKQIKAGQGQKQKQASGAAGRASATGSKKAPVVLD